EGKGLTVFALNLKSLDEVLEAITLVKGQSLSLYSL
ncbi:unnamed protein product, partial [marine sediment metagenome]